MKLRPVTKLDKRNTSTSKNLVMTSCRQIVTLFFFIYSNLQSSGRGIPNKWPKKLPITLIVTFYLTQPENRAKKSLTQLSYYCFEQGAISAKKNPDFLQKKC